MLPGKQTQVRFFKSMIVGGIGAGVNVGAIALFATFMRPAKADNLAYAASVVTHYTLNRFWALPSSRSDTGRQFLEYLGTVVLGWAIQHACFLLGYYELHLPLVWAKVIAIPPSTLAVFFLLNHHVFRHRQVTRRSV